MINFGSSTLPPSSDTPRVLWIQTYQPILWTMPHTPKQTLRVNYFRIITMLLAMPNATQAKSFLPYQDAVCAANRIHIHSKNYLDWGHLWWHPHKMELTALTSPQHLFLHWKDKTQNQIYIIMSFSPLSLSSTMPKLFITNTVHLSWKCHRHVADMSWHVFFF